MRFGILGTGVVGRTIAAGLDGMGHEVMVGTRNPEGTASRAEPDTYGNPPFSVWQEEHPEVRLATFSERLLTVRWLSTPPPAPSP